MNNGQVLLFNNQTKQVLMNLMIQLGEILDNKLIKDFIIISLNLSNMRIQIILIGTMFEEN